MDLKKIDKKEVSKFLDAHPDKPISAAKFEYSLYLEPEVEKYAAEIIKNNFVKTEELLVEKAIVQTVDSKDLLKLMRKPLSGLNKNILREKILEQEENMIPLIKEKSMTSGQDIFIENALYFFLHCKENCCDWIMEEYSNFRNEYLKSMFCLILGFKGEADLIPFLMKETERFEREYPEEDFEQAPILAVQELAVRFLN